MKTLTTIILISMTSFGSTTAEKNKNCFSKTNFDNVYQYLDSQIKESDEAFYKYDKYELWLSDTTEITFKKDGYTLSRIRREKGVFALPKSKKDNDKMVAKTHQMFCELLLLADKNIDKK